jgi:transcriptional regulator with XRE-family HTH domain
MTAKISPVAALRAWQTMSFGEWLKAERQKRSWTLEMMADKADTTHASISRLESGRAGASQKMVTRIAEALAGENALPETVERLRKEGLAALVGLEPEMERVIDDEEWEVIQAYRGLESGIKRNFRGFLLSASGSPLPSS